MSGRRDEPALADALREWAADRAPELAARAEAEAVRVLRDALVAASLGVGDEPPPRRPAPEPSAVPEPPAVPAPSTTPAAEGPDLLWAFCVLRAADPVPEGLAGISADAVQRVPAGDLVALVSCVPAADFAAEPLARNLNDLRWLERVARAHEAVLDAALAQATIVPLRMCTIYETTDGVRQMLERRHEPLTQALEALDGRLEWSVKVLVDSERLMQAARPAGTGAPGPAGEGGAYLQRRREEREAREAASGLAADVAEQVHARLQDWAIDARTRPPQNRELSGHEGEMVLNAAYLVERERTEELRRLVAELEDHHRDLGARIELTGPWPPYNFVHGADTAALA